MNRGILDTCENQYCTGTLTFDTSYYEYLFETKNQAKFDKSDPIFKKPEEELMDFIKQHHQELKQVE